MITNIIPVMHKTKIDFLVVDDFETMRGVIRNMLMRTYGTNVKIETAKSGKEALHIVKSNNVQMVVTDWNMPNMTGIELLQVIRNDPKLFEIPVLMVSDEISNDKITYALKETVDSFLIKPFNEQDLMARIQEIRTKRASRTPIDNKLIILRKLQLQKRYDKAIQMCKELLKEERHPDVLFLISECYYMQKEYSNARFHLRNLIDANSESKVNYLYGRILMAVGETEQAVEYLEKASGLNPLNVELRIDVGSVYLELGLEDEALEIFDRVKKANPTDMNLVKIGKVLLKHGRTGQAGEFLRETVEPIPETMSTFNTYALELKKQGLLEESIAQYRKCLGLVPDHPTVLYNIGMIYFEMGKSKAAIESLRAAIKEKPDFEKARRLLDYLEQQKR